MSKVKKPDYLKPPLRKREDIINWLLDPPDWSHRGWRGDGSYFYCRNVKLHRVDLSFENLVKRFKEAHGVDSYGFHLEDPEFLKLALAAHEENEGYLLDWGIEDARNDWRSNRTADDGAPDGDAYSTVWDGTHVDVRYRFLGRQGGWLVLERYEHEQLDTSHISDLEGFLNDQSYDWLKLFYTYLFEITAFLRRHTPEQRVEEAAAWSLLVNICGEDMQAQADRKREATAAALISWEAEIWP